MQFVFAVMWASNCLKIHVQLQDNGKPCSTVSCKSIISAAMHERCVVCEGASLAVYCLISSSMLLNLLLANMPHKVCFHLHCSEATRRLLLKIHSQPTSNVKAC